MNFKKLSAEPLDQNLVIRLLLGLFSVAIITMSFDSFASGDPVGSTLCNVILIFSGNTARGIAVVGIIVLGIQTLRGKLQWEVALVIIAAIIILFKAPDLVSIISGNSANSGCGTTKITS